MLRPKGCEKALSHSKHDKSLQAFFQGYGLASTVPHLKEHTRSYHSCISRDPPYSLPKRQKKLCFMYSEHFELPPPSPQVPSEDLDSGRVPQQQQIHKKLLLHPGLILPEKSWIRPKLAAVTCFGLSALCYTANVKT